MMRAIDVPLTPQAFFNLTMRLANDSFTMQSSFKEVEPGVDARLLALYGHGIPVEETTMSLFKGERVLPISPFRRRMLELCVQEGLLTAFNVKDADGDLVSRKWYMTEKGLKWVKSVYAARYL